MNDLWVSSAIVLCCFILLCYWLYHKNVEGKHNFNFSILKHLWVVNCWWVTLTSDKEYTVKIIVTY